MPRDLPPQSMAGVDTLLIGLNPHRPLPNDRMFPILSDATVTRIYLNPEHANVKLADPIRVVQISPRSESSKEEEDPRARLRFEMWHEWQERLDEAPPISFSEYRSLEKEMARTVHDILHEETRRTIIFLPYFWLVPDSMWRFLTAEDQHRIRVYSPMIGDASRFPYGDETYLGTEELRSQDL